MTSRRHVHVTASRLCALLLALAMLALGLVSAAAPAQATTGTVSLTATPGYFATDSNTLLVAGLSQPLGAYKTLSTDPNPNILIKDLTDNTIFGQCIGQDSTSCSIGRAPQADRPHQFVAYVGQWDKTNNTVTDVKATSPTITVGWRPFTPQMSVQRSVAGVDLLATVSQPTRDSGYGFLIYNQTANRVEALCGGPSLFCKATLAASAVQPTDTFVALVAQSRTYTGVPPSLESSPAASLLSPGPSPQNLLGGKVKSQKCVQGCGGDPVNTATGVFWDTETDLAIAARGPALAWTRNYSASLASVNGPLGYGWRLGYGMNTRTDTTTGAVTVVQENGSELLFTPDGSGGFTAAPTVLADLTTVSGGGLRFVRRDGRTAYLFDTTGRLVSVADRNGETTSLAYDGAGHLSTVTDPAGRALTVTWTGARVTKTTDVAGRTVTYSYGAAGNLISVVDTTGKSTTYTYDTVHRLLTRTDPRGGVLTNVYDQTTGKVATQTDPAGRTTRFAYGTSAGLDTTDVTDPLGTVRRQYYWGGVLVQTTDAYGTTAAAVTKYAYDPRSLGTIATTDPNGLVTTATYDTDGHPTSTADPAGASTVMTYSPAGDLLTRTTPLNVITTNTYDTAGNLTGTTTAPPGVAPVTVAYAHANATHKGDLTSSTNPRGKTTVYGRNPTTGMVNAVTDPLGRKTTTTYDNVSRPVTSVSPRGNATGGVPADHRTTLTYDKADRVLTTTDPDGHVTSTTYDGNGNPVTVTDPDGKVTTTAYDPMDRLTAVTRPDLTVVKTGYDDAGNLTTQTDALLRQTVYGHDVLGRTVLVTDPAGRATAYTYDPGGRLATQTDPAGAVVTYAYDPAGRVTGRTYPTGTTNVSLSYDKAGRRTRSVDATGATEYTYDALDRLVLVSGGGVGDRRYGYDQAGNVTAVTYPNGQTVGRSYDDAGQWTGTTDWTAQQFTSAYDADGEFTGRTDPNGTAETRAYDDTGRTSSVTHTVGATVLASFAYGYDAAGQVTSWTPTGTGAAPRTTTYTDNGRVGTVNTAPYAWSTGDDLTGTPDGTVIGYDTAAQPATLTPTAGTPSTYAYDSSGNRTGQTTGASATTLGWDRENHLSTYTAGGTSTAYTYGADGLRGSKKVGAAAVERFAWDTVGQVPLLLADNTNMYLWGPGRTLLEQKPFAGGTAVYAHEDALGTVHALTNQTGAVVATSTYDTHGRRTGSTGTATSPFGWAGEYQDTESGLVYLRARYYDPASGQFLSRDPLVDVTRDAYGYAFGDPLDMVDPLGLWSLSKTFGLISVTANAVSTISGTVALAALFVPGGQGVALALGPVSAAAAGVALGADVLQKVVGDGSPTPTDFLLDSLGTAGGASAVAIGFFPKALEISDDASTAYSVASGLVAAGTGFISNVRSTISMMNSRSETGAQTCP